MCQFIETICIKNRKIENILLHQKRLNYTQKSFFKNHLNIDLLSIINIPLELLNEPLIKCRIIYDKSIISISYEKYKIKQIKTLQIIETNNLNYNFKNKNRQLLDELYNNKNESDDILIINNNLVTDTYYCNVVFETFNKEYFTPDTFLLNGIKRQLYLNKKIITETKISKTEINKYKNIHLINSMINLNEIKLNIDNCINY